MHLIRLLQRWLESNTPFIHRVRVKRVAAGIEDGWDASVSSRTLCLSDNFVQLGVLQAEPNSDKEPH